MRTLVVGDLHGAFKGLMEALTLAQYDPDNDHLIVLGDVCDGWSQIKETVQFLINKGAVVVRGNHDWYATQWMASKLIDPKWLEQGGLSTISAYQDGVPESHRAFFMKMPFYHVDDKDRVYVHAGWDVTKHRRVSGAKADPFKYMHDNSLWEQTIEQSIKDEGPATDHPFVFKGHQYCGNTPVVVNGVANLDTGAAWDGCVTVMDADTLEYWQSSPVQELYSDECVRRVKLR